MKISLNVTVFFLMCFAMFGCKKYDTDYKSFLDNHEVIYPGLASGVTYHAGNLRTVLVWHPSPDPSIKRYVVFWNNGLDSVLVNATTHDPGDSITVNIPNLKEYVYSFKIIAHDNDGHVSIGQDLNNVRVYGPTYQASLLNRSYNAAKPFVLYPDGSVDLNFNKADSGNVATAIKFTNNNGETKTVSLKPGDGKINLPNFKYGSPVTYRSSYLPLVNAIDTFSVVNEETFPTVQPLGDVTSLFIQNAGRPIYRKDSGTGKWGLLKDWQYNSAVVNQNGGTGGGFSTDDGGVIHVEPKDYSGDPVNNGKIWQSFKLPAGNYSIDFETGYNGGTYQANALAVAGTELPDIDNLGSALAIFKGDQSNMGGTHTITFKLTAETTVAVGWVVHLESNTYLQFRSIKLKRAEL